MFASVEFEASPHRHRDHCREQHASDRGATSPPLRALLSYRQHRGCDHGRPPFFSAVTTVYQHSALPQHL
jgi:hypothetical protein